MKPTSLSVAPRPCKMTSRRVGVSAEQLGRWLAGQEPVPAEIRTKAVELVLRSESAGDAGLGWRRSDEQ